MIVMVWQTLAAVPPGTRQWLIVAIPSWMSRDHHLTPQPNYSAHRAVREG